MLTNTFVHLPGVGPVREKSLWSKGIRDWSELDSNAHTLFKPEQAQTVRELLSESRRHLDSGNYHFFYQTLPRPELWRLVPKCIDRMAYLDIETTGQYLPPRCKSTAIAVSFRGKLYQEHERAKKEELLRFLHDEATAFCTFFGEVFDIPFLRAEYDLPFDKAHFDLCFWLKRHGYRGGLKKIEKMFPDIPSRAALDIDGWDAVRLWRFHQKGMPGALETLLTYNAEDTIVLEALLAKAYNFEVKKRPEWALAELPTPAVPKVPTKIDENVYRALRASAW